MLIYRQRRNKSYLRSKVVYTGYNTKWNDIWNLIYNNCKAIAILILSNKCDDLHIHSGHKILISA